MKPLKEKIKELTEDKKVLETRVKYAEEAMQLRGTSQCRPMFTNEKENVQKKVVPQEVPVFNSAIKPLPKIDYKTVSIYI